MRYERELHSQREQAHEHIQANHEIILRCALQTELHNKNDLINTERNLLECQVRSDRVSSPVGDTEVIMMERDALKLEVENLRGLREEVAALNKLIDNLITERDQLSQERDDLMFKSRRQVQDMQKDNDSLKCEIEYLRSKYSNIAAVKEQLKTVTTEQQRLKKVRDAMQLEMEYLRGQYNDTATLIEQKGKVTLGARPQTRDTEAREVRDALKPETNDLRCHCMNAAALKEQLNITTVQRLKLIKWRKALVIVIIFALCFSVGLLWARSDTPLASGYKTSSSHSPHISATVMPSFDIIV